jgi:hypothetical protein
MRKKGIPWSSNIYIKKSSNGYQIREEWETVIKEAKVLKELPSHGIS